MEICPKNYFELKRSNGVDKYDLNSILCSETRDFLVRNNGDQVKVNSLKENRVGLYFSASWCGECEKFTPLLVEVYNNLKKHAEFEIVLISDGNDNKSFDAYFSKMPWLAVPFSDSETRQKLLKLFDIGGIPQLIILGKNGKVLTQGGVEIVENCQGEEYTSILEQIERLEDDDHDDQSLTSLLVRKSHDYVITNDGEKIPVSRLVGKTILLFFSANWCSACRAFLPELIQAYQEIKSNEDDDDLEVIFISSDKNKKSFNKYFSEMPWLAIPYGDKRKNYLNNLFKVNSIPTVVAIGPNGETLTTKAKELITSHGSDAYPFTDSHIMKIEAKDEKIAEGWPKKVKYACKYHELVLTKQFVFKCDGCGEEGNMWCYCCEETGFALHPKCVLKDDDKGRKGDEDDEDDEDDEEGCM